MKNKNSKYRPLIRVCLPIVRLFSRKRKVVGRLPNAPCVFLCRHMDQSGVIGAYTSINTVLRPLVLDTFFSYEDAKNHLKNYTFSEKKKKGKVFKAIVAPICAKFFVRMVKSVEAIPVYRGKNGMRSITTIKESVRALENGDNIIIFPDFDYADKSEKQTGEIYKGFISIAKLYFRRNNERLKFVPVCLKEKRLVVHEPIYLMEGEEESFFEAVVRGMYNE